MTGPAACSAASAPAMRPHPEDAALSALRNPARSPPDEAQNIPGHAPWGQEQPWRPSRACHGTVSGEAYSYRAGGIQQGPRRGWVSQTRSRQEKPDTEPTKQESIITTSNDNNEVQGRTKLTYGLHTETLPVLGVGCSSCLMEEEKQE